MSRSVRLLICMAIMAMPALLTGCWNSFEIDRRAIITAAAFDLAETPGKIALTLQVANPSKVRQGGKDAVFLASSTANTVLEASRVISNTLSRKPFWGQLQVLVIGESLAQEGIAEWLDFMDRDFEPNRRVYVLIAKGVPGHQVLQAGLGFGSIPASNLMALVNNAKARGRVVVSNMNNIIASLESEGQDPATGFVELDLESKIPPNQLDMEQQATLKGTAVFSLDKLVGYMEDHASRGIRWLKGDSGSTIVVVPGQHKSTDQISLEVVQSDTKIQAEVKNGRPIINVKISLHAHVTEARTQHLDLTKSAQYEELDRRLATSVVAEIEESIKQAQILKADVFGFGATFGRTYPKEWKKIKDQWRDEIFPKLEVKIEAKAHVLRSGFLYKPVQVK